MTSKLIRQKTPAGIKEKFPEFPPRDDMQNFFHLNRPGYPTALDRHFGLSDSTVVMCEAPLRWRPGQRRGHRIPDLLIAFNVDRAAATFQMGYSISEQGKPPDFVLEVASSSTGEKDYEEKRDAYAKFGVLEYWRFDSSGGDNHDAPLAGDRLVDGAYQPIEIVRIDENRLWGYSAVLNLVLCWEEGRLRWWDPVTQRYLETHDEEAEGRIAEREGRIIAEARADSEHEARIQAEARIHELEEELQRLKNPDPDA